MSNQVSKLLESNESNPLIRLLQKDAEDQLPHLLRGETRYQHYVMETPVSGLPTLHPLRDYSEGELTAIAIQPTFRFRWRCERLLEQAQRLMTLEENSLEFEQEATLLWAKIAALSEHLGSTPEVDELISALHSAYAQHVQRLTPATVINALVSVLQIVSRYTRLSISAVDEALDALENGGIDLNYPMSFERADG